MRTGGPEVMYCGRFLFSFITDEMCTEGDKKRIPSRMQQMEPGLINDGVHMG